MNVTPTSIFAWDAVLGAAGYQVRAKDSIQNVITPAPGVIDVGTATSTPVSTLLDGQPPGNYTLEVRAVEDGGANPTPFSGIAVTIPALVAPGGLRIE